MAATHERHDRHLIEQLGRGVGRAWLTDAEVEAQLDQAWRDLRGSVASQDRLPEMMVRPAMTRLHGTADTDTGDHDSESRPSVPAADLVVTTMASPPRRPSPQPSWPAMFVAGARRHRIDFVVIAATLIFLAVAAKTGLALVHGG